jgi:hypothetical protein
MADLDLTDIMGRGPGGTTCLESALARFELIDEVPTSTDIAIPRGQRTLKTQAAVAWHPVDRATCPIGLAL